MSILVENPTAIHHHEAPVQHHQPTEGRALRDHVEQAMRNYFSQLGDQPVTNVYEMVISEIEPPLLEAVMSYTKGNQSKAAIILGISRGTLRKKLKQYGIERVE